MTLNSLGVLLIDFILLKNVFMEIQNDGYYDIRSWRLKLRKFGCCNDDIFQIK